MSALSVIESSAYQNAFLKHLSCGEGEFVLTEQQDSLKDGFYFCTDHPSDIQHDAIIRESRCFFVSSTGMLCLFQDTLALQGDVILFVDNESCIYPVGTTPFNLIHELNGGSLILDGVSNTTEFMQCCERNFGRIQWDAEPERISLYLSKFDR